MSSSRQHNGNPSIFLARSGDGAFFDAELSGDMADWSAAPQPDARRAAAVLCAILPVTPRQAEVLHWMAEAKSNDEIAGILGCSTNTVKTHVREIFERLKVHSRTAAAACAYRAHLIHANGNTPSPDRAILQKKHSD